jgi:hypothetical protein
MSEVCLFCNKPERNRKPGKNVEFVCSNCVIILADAEQDDLKFAHKKATELSSARQLRALELFIIGEENGQQKPETKFNRRHSNRKRSVKSIGSKEERLGRVQVQSKTTILQDQ